MRFCPSCGYSFEQDKIVDRDHFTIDPRGALYYRGQFIRATPQQIGIFHTIASINRIVSAEVISNRVGSDEVANPSNGVSVQLSRLRTLFEYSHIPWPIVSYRGRQRGGYLWCPEEANQQRIKKGGRPAKSAASQKGSPNG